MPAGSLSLIEISWWRRDSNFIPLPFLQFLTLTGNNLDGVMMADIACGDAEVHASHLYEP